MHDIADNQHVGPLQVEAQPKEQLIHGEPNRIRATTSFRKLVTDTCAFVDKSLLIKEILDDQSDAILITRPDKWGKTLNMDMIRTFFNPDVDDELYC